MNQRDAFGQSALWLACRFGCRDHVNPLLKAKVLWVGCRKSFFFSCRRSRVLFGFGMIWRRYIYDTLYFLYIYIYIYTKLSIIITFRDLTMFWVTALQGFRTSTASPHETDKNHHLRSSPSGWFGASRWASGVLLKCCQLANSEPRLLSLLSLRSLSAYLFKALHGSSIALNPHVVSVVGYGILVGP